MANNIIVMQAASGFTGTVSCTQSTPPQSGQTYQPDAFGFVTVDPRDVAAMIMAGFSVVQPGTKNDNFTATTDPGPTNDSTQDYVVGSVWINTTTGRTWDCQVATAGAAVWQERPITMIGRIIAANFNITTDQPFVMDIPATARFRVNRITAENTSVAGMSTAAGGVYPAATKSGTALVAAGQVYTGLTNAATALDLTLATPNAIQAAGTIPKLSLTTGQGAAATADLYMYGDVYT
jgi:hypothetical protein